MGLKDDIWRIFVRTAKLEMVGVDFRTKKKTYEGIGFDAMTEEQIRQTWMFRGFSDGYCRNDHAIKGPKGAVEHASGMDGLDRVIADYKTMCEEGGLQEDLARSQMWGEIEERFPQGAYDHFYNIGLTKAPAKEGRL